MKLTILILFFATLAQAKLVDKTVSYTLNEKTFEGYVVYDTQFTGAQPGALVVHDWMGLTDRTKAKAKELAALGFTAFAADIYGKGKIPKNSEEAAAQAGIYKNNRPLFRDHLNAAFNELKKIKNVNTKKMVAIGFCFGGTGVVELARSGAPLLGVVSFHGSLDSPKPEDGKNIKAKVLALHGADDPFVAAKDLTAFEEEMKINKIDWQLVKYGGAVHSFTDKSAGTDNSKGAAYNESADKRSFQAMKDFFKELI